MRAETVLFDLDGTLTDPAEGITNSVAYALERYGIKTDDKRELCKFIGPPLAESFVKYYGFTEEEGIRAVGIYREYFSSRGIFENVLYPGIPEMLCDLQNAGKRLVLATSKPEIFAEKILVHFGIDKYFYYAAGATLDGRTDKHEVIEYALGECDITDRSGVVMVGDREHDIIGAKKSAISSVGVLYGYGSPEELEYAGADRIACTVEELREFLLKI